MSDATGSVPASAHADIASRMAQLGQRYLDRTAGELNELKALVDALPSGDETGLKNIEVLSHRIRGSGAMFGFELVSDVAGEIELLIVDARRGLQPDRAALQMRLRALLRVLTFVLKSARQ